MRRWLLSLLVLLLLPAGAEERPRLVVVIVIDQFRADYLDRFYDHFLPDAPGKPGGFRYLLDGAWERQCFYDHFPLETSVGHAAISTGSLPAQHGIISNSWYDRQLKTVVQSMEDRSMPRVFSRHNPVAHPPPELGASPKNLIGTTLGDELKNALPGSKVISVSLKERAAIMMGGHRADLATWYDELSGNWISSQYYCRQLPDWLERLNDEGWAEAHKGWTWTPLVPELVGGTRPSPQSGSVGMVAVGRKLPTDASFYNQLGFTPLGVDYTLLAARRAVVAESLGADADTDILFISLSSIDKLGHQEGPYGPEMQDMMLRTDRSLADFFAFLQERGLLADTVFALSGDHGGAALPESSRLPHGRLPPDVLKKNVNAALVGVLGPGEWVIDCHPPEIYLDPRARRDDALKAACAAIEAEDGVHVAVSCLDIERNTLQPEMALDQVARSFNRRRSPEILVVMAPYWLSTDRPAGTSHNPVWTYDTKVPLVLRGPGIARGLFTELCTPRDIAPTLCELLAIPPPAMSSGRVLQKVLEGRR